MLRRSGGDRQPSNFLNSSRGKKTWSVEEDEALKNLVETLGTGNWTLIAQSLSERTGKQCRERWHNHLDNGIKKGDWSEEEDKIIVTLQKAIGNQWAKITKMLPGRTDNAVKNRFHATERAKSRGKWDESLYTVPIDENFVRCLKKLNSEVDLNDLYDAGLLNHPNNSYSTQKSTTTLYPEAFVSYSCNFNSEAYVSQVDVNKHNLLNENAESFATNVTAIPIDNETDQEHDLELEQLEEDPMDCLMDLDIISFDEDLMDCGFSFDIPETSNGGICGSELDSCCNFDWTLSSSNQPKNTFTSPIKQEQKPVSNWCGMDWSAGTSRPTYQNTYNMYSNSGQHLNQQQTQSQTATSFFCSR